ncbi:MAG: hypothetical protein KDJ17_12005 [Hyphomicrobiaceae bacterium]|nr:hypothetical protein [Hyphomicrobiaceae bacterium]
MARGPEAFNDLMRALDAALAGDWERVHPIVQAHEGDPLANWLHALHHKLEGDASNARYWYAKSPMDYERFPDPKAELRAIHHALVHED